MIEQEIFCRIIKLDVQDEDVVVDRRVVLEDRERAEKDRLFAELNEGATVSATVRSLMDYGAFVDLGGVDALLHVSDISWSRVNKAAEVLAVGQPVEVKVLKIASEGGKQRISVGMKQLQPHPWDAAPGKFRVGERIRGKVTRVTDFGAFVELEPAIEGLIHVSEMSWGRKLRRADTLVKPGESVDAVILGINAEERRISLGLKQALGDPWADAAQHFPAGSVIQGPVVSLTKFGAFVQLTEGVEGMIHVSDFSAEKHINHPQEMVKVGQIVKAQVLAIDPAKRQVRLGIKQLAPTGLDEYLAEHKEGDVVSGRIAELSDGHARVELGEGVEAVCRLNAHNGHDQASTENSHDLSASKPAKVDLTSLGSMLQARWKGNAMVEAESRAVHRGEVRKFKITRLDAPAKKIELKLE